MMSTSAVLDGESDGHLVVEWDISFLKENQQQDANENRVFKKLHWENYSYNL